MKWVYNVDVLVPWRGELAELDTRIAVETQKVVDILAQYPRLKATAGIQRADLVAGTTADRISEKKGVYRGKRHTLNILEIVTQEGRNNGRICILKFEGFTNSANGWKQLTKTELFIIFNEGLRDIGRLFVPAKGTGPLADETPKRSGKLARSSVFQIMGGPEEQRLEIRQGAKSPLGVFYGFIVREGRGPVHAIKAKALHFFIGGQEFFRKSVGPAAPNPYHIRVLDRLYAGSPGNRQRNGPESRRLYVRRIN